MKLEVKIELLKFSFAVLNSIFLVLGLSVMGCGIWILFDTGSFLNVLSSAELRLIAAGLFLIGGVVVLVSFTGCAAATMEKRFLLLVYLGFLIVLVLGQLYFTVLLLLNRGKIDQSLTETVDRIMFEYGNSSSSNSGGRIMDNVQHFVSLPTVGSPSCFKTECCGRTGPADWLKNSFVQTLNLTSPDVLPCSCFRSSEPDLNSSWCSENPIFFEPWIRHGNGTFNQSCSQKITDWLQENILTIVAMDAILILLEIIELSIAGSLFRKLGEKEEEKKTSKQTNQVVDEDHAHLDSSPEADLDGGEQNYAFLDPDGGPTDPNYIAAGDANNMAYDYQNQGFQEPLYNYQNQDQGHHGYQVQHY